MISNLKLRIRGSAEEKEFLLESNPNPPGETSSNRYFPIITMKIVERDCHCAVFQGTYARDLCAIRDDLESAARAAYDEVRQIARRIHDENNCTSPIEDLTEYAPTPE